VGAKTNYGQAAYYGFPSGKLDHIGPVPVVDQGQSEFGDFLAVSAGGNFTCGLLYSSVWCWGDNGYGQFGVSPSADVPDDSVVFETVVVRGVANAVDIAAGGKHTCAMVVDGTILCWGDDPYGQHGDGNTGQLAIDRALNIRGTFLGRGVAAGNQFPCALRGNGTAACWGAGEQGQLGNGANVSSPNPVAVTGLTNLAPIATGSSHTCAAEATGKVSCWGDNSQYQLGNLTPTQSNLPVSDKPGRAFTGDVRWGASHVQRLEYGRDLVLWGK